MLPITSADVISCEITNSASYEDYWRWDTVHYCLLAMDSPSHCQWPPTDACCPRVTHNAESLLGLYIRYHRKLLKYGVVVGTLALINEVNLRRIRLVLRWVTVSGSIPGAGHLLQYVTNQPPKANSAFHPSGVGKWVPASAGKAKAGMVHSVSGWTRGVQVKLRDPLRTRAIPERLRGAFTTRRYTNPRLLLPLPSATESVGQWWNYM